MASDFELWVRFFRHARLQTTSGLIGGFRFHARQRTSEQIEAYEAEAQRIVVDELGGLSQNGLPHPYSDLWITAPPVLKYDWRFRELRPVPPRRLSDGLGRRCRLRSRGHASAGSWPGCAP